MDFLFVSVAKRPGGRIEHLVLRCPFVNAQLVALPSMERTVHSPDGARIPSTRAEFRECEYYTVDSDGAGFFVTFDWLCNEASLLRLSLLQRLDRKSCGFERLGICELISRICEARYGSLKLLGSNQVIAHSLIRATHFIHPIPITSALLFSLAVNETFPVIERKRSVRGGKCLCDTLRRTWQRCEQIPAPKRDRGCVAQLHR